VTAIWKATIGGWTLLTAAGFPDEATLHRLVEETPALLPLSGSPQLAVVGREVLLGSGYADLLAVETTGRMAIIEVKLARNSEARRAVVAQVLAYAAVLHGQSLERLETEVLGQHLGAREYASLADAARQAEQTASFDEEAFKQMLAESLRRGNCRLVLVLDEAPAELIRLAGYLQAITDTLVVDLITVTSYDVDGTQILVPQRVDPERVQQEPGEPPERPHGATGTLIAGGEPFLGVVQREPADRQPPLRRLHDWAVSLQNQGLVRLFTYFGKRGEVTLLPRLQPDNVGLVTIWNWNGTGYLSVWRSVFERRAPESIATVERLIAPVPLGKGNTVNQISDQLLDALTQAYRAAARGPVAPATGEPSVSA
jgi:hypothetical protein